MTTEKEMPFLEHLEELRWHILRSIGAVLVLSIAAFLLKTAVFDWILFGPTRPSFPTYQLFCQLGEMLNVQSICITDISVELQNTTLAGQFLTHLRVSIIVGCILAFPYIFWEIWRFVKPGLYGPEIKQTRLLVGSSSFLFFTGVLFGYFVLLPFAIHFFVNYSVSNTVSNIFILSKYIGQVSMIVAGCGLMFQLPVAVYMMSKLGFVTPNDMRKYRKHSAVAILIISAMITPADVATQIFIAMPIYFLYEISIFISANVYRKRQKALAQS